MTKKLYIFCQSGEVVCIRSKFCIYWTYQPNIFCAHAWLYAQGPLVLAVNHNFWKSYFMECLVLHRSWQLTHSYWLACRGCKWSTASVSNLVSSIYIAYRDQQRWNEMSMWAWVSRMEKIIHLGGWRVDDLGLHVDLSDVRADSRTTHDTAGRYLHSSSSLCYKVVIVTAAYHSSGKKAAMPKGSLEKR